MPQTVNIWNKFLELRCIIDSSLQNIEDRWKEGKVGLACLGNYIYTGCGGSVIIKSGFTGSEAGGGSHKPIGDGAQEGAIFD